MAIVLVASTSGTPSGGVTTTPSINTTGANFLVASISIYSSGSPTVTDSKGNTWTSLPLINNGNAIHRLFYAFSPTVGSGHTFTSNPGSDYSIIFVYAFSGVDSYHSESRNINSFTATSIASGSLTPTLNGSLFISGTAVATQTPTLSLTAGFTVSSITHVPGVNIGGGAAYYVQPTAGALNPTWGYSPGVNPGVVGSAVFLPTLAPSTGRVTQDVIEILSLPVPTARITQNAVEILSATTPVPGRVTQYVIEILSQEITIPTVTETTQFYVIMP